MVRKTGIRVAADSGRAKSLRPLRGRHANRCKKHGRCETSRMVDEAPLRMSKNGLVADVRGWFVVNARESRWRDAGPLGVFCTFEGKKPFLQLGFNISVLEPGQPMGRYHREDNAQEGFLVLSGTCVLDRRRRGADARPVGLLPLPARNRAHHRREGESRGGRDRRTRPRARRRRLSGLGRGRAARRERRARDHDVQRGIRRPPEVEVDALRGGLAAEAP